jgi:TPR repeat protein
VKTTSVLPPGRTLHQQAERGITLPEAQPKEVKSEPRRAIHASRGCSNGDQQPEGVEGDCTDRLLVKADELLRRGDVGGARLVLERALGEGSELAAFRLAETYDPKRLSAWGVLGTKPDPGKARQLYERACAAGIQCKRGSALRR